MHFLKTCNHYLYREQKHLSGASAIQLIPAYASLPKVFQIVCDSDEETTIYLRMDLGLNYFSLFQGFCTGISELKGSSEEFYWKCVKEESLLNRSHNI